MKRILFFIFSIYVCAYAQNIKLMTETFPPYQYLYKDKVIGISVDIVNKIQDNLKINNQIGIYPWSKALSILNDTNDAALFSMLRTPNREHLYKWVGPLTSMELVFFKKKGSKITLNNIEDAKKVNKVGVTRGVANFEMLREKDFHNLMVIEEGEDEQNIQKLVDGEIDLWPSLRMAGLYNARLQGLSGEIVAIEDVVAFSGDLYIAFNINTDDKIIAQWQSTLNKMKQDGKIDEIIARYRDDDTIDYSLFIKLGFVLFIISSFAIYHNRKLSKTNAELHILKEKLQEQANRDYMTNLYNRRFFSQMAEKIFSIRKRDNQEMSIVMLDIDHFKTVNDTYGHKCGDSVIKSIAAILTNNTRQSDIVARFGGEEFVILLPNTSIKGALVISQKIKNDIESTHIESSNASKVKVTISMGIAVVNDTDVSIEDSLMRADNALYGAKESGRNKINVSS